MSTNNNKRLLHRKEWQLMTPCPVTAASGCVYIGDDSARNRFTLHIQSVSSQWLYDHEEDAWIQIPSGGFAGTFGAGTAGQYYPWSMTITSTGGTNNTFNVTSSLFNLSRFIKGCTIEFLSGANIGLTAVINEITNDNTTCTITLSSNLPNVVSNNDTFRISSGRFFVLNAYSGAATAGVFKAFDIATMSWTGTGSIPQLTITGLPTTWGTDGAMTTPYQFSNSYLTGTAVSGTSTTITIGSQLAVNVFKNYQIKITGGTGRGQIRKIFSNTSASNSIITISLAWATTPDSTSTFVIEAAEDIYLIGNNGTTLYRYSVLSDSSGWQVASSTVPLASGTGCTLDAICNATESWLNDLSPSNIFRNGRYLYNFRGAGTSTLYRYDIVADSWASIVYTPLQETFTTGSSSNAYGSKIYIRKDGTNRFFYYDVVANDIVPFTTNLYTDATAVVGQKIWIKKYDDQTMWLYSIRNQDVILHRIMMF